MCQGHPARVGLGTLLLARRPGRQPASTLTRISRLSTSRPVHAMRSRLPGELRCKANRQECYCGGVPPVFGPWVIKRPLRWSRR
jgi:hypothetical protein